jgi:hypothetical protein
LAGKGKERFRMEPGEDEPSVPLATRIPKALHRKLKLHCVITETAVMDFVTSAVREKLARSEGAPEATKRKAYRLREHRD